MTQKHTPLPWHVTAKHQRQISDKRGFKIAKCLIHTKGANFHLPDGEADGNAAFIVEACNSHYDLKARLAEAEALIEDTLALKPFGYYPEIFTRAQSFLSKAQDDAATAEAMHTGDYSAMVKKGGDA